MLRRKIKMRRPYSLFVVAILGCSIALRTAGAGAGAQNPGVDEDGIRIGMEGPSGSYSVDEENLGMRLVIEHVNANGGIHGRRLVERSYPRGSESQSPLAQQVANAKRLITEDDIFLLFNFGGPSSVAIGELAVDEKVPYLFPHTALLTPDGERYIFTSFPRYEGETRVMLRHLAERGAKRLGVIHAANDYGNYFVSRTKELSDELGYAFVGAESIERSPASAEREMRQMRQTDADAIILAIYPEQARRVVEARSLLAWGVRLVSSGPLTDEAYLDVGGGRADGTLGFCHFPDPERSGAPGVERYRELMARYLPGRELNRYSLYGYVFGLLVVEGLGRAGPDLTRDGFLDAMETIEGWDSGGILPPVSFSRTNHHAQNAGFICELVNGRFEPRTEWLTP
jgi:ABC-type branched-subunit amino acid transport system substrate-binding protein